MDTSTPSLGIVRTSEQKNELGKRKPSQKQIEANRCNALKSTGPKSARGKRIVSQNALTHGLLANEVISRFSSDEDKAEYNDLLVALQGHYQPMGIEESLLVEEITRKWWARKIAARNQRIEWERPQIRLMRKDLDQERNLQIAVGAALVNLPEPRRELPRASTMGVEMLLLWLQETKKIMESNCVDSPEYQRMTSFLPSLFSRLWAQDKSECLAEIEEETSKLEARKMVLAAIERWEAESGVPSKESIDLLLRYERANDRQLDRAIARLQELQQQRKGMGQFSI